MVFSTYQDHYNLSHDEATAKIAKKLNYENVDALKTECKTNPELNNAINAFCDAFAEVRSSLNFSDSHRYSNGSEVEIQNWGEARKLFDKLYPGGDLSDFDSEDFQEALFEKFFEPNPNSGEDGNPLKLQNNFHLFTSKRFSLQKIIAKGLARQFWHFVQTGGFKCRCRAV